VGARLKEFYYNKNGKCVVPVEEWPQRIIVSTHLQNEQMSRDNTVAASKNLN